MVNSSNNRGLGGVKMAINEKVEVISHSNEDLYGKVGIIKDMKKWDQGTELKVSLEEDGYETWIDAGDVLLQNF